MAIEDDLDKSKRRKRRLTEVAKQANAASQQLLERSHLEDAQRQQELADKKILDSLTAELHGRKEELSLANARKLIEVRPDLSPPSGTLERLEREGLFRKPSRERKERRKRSAVEVSSSNNSISIPAMDTVATESTQELVVDGIEAVNNSLVNTVKAIDNIPRDITEAFKISNDNITGVMQEAFVAQEAATISLESIDQKIEEVSDNTAALTKIRDLTDVLVEENEALHETAVEGNSFLKKMMDYLSSTDQSLKDYNAREYEKDRKRKRDEARKLAMDRRMGILPTDPRTRGQKIYDKLVDYDSGTDKTIKTVSSMFRGLGFLGTALSTGIGATLGPMLMQVLPMLKGGGYVMQLQNVAKFFLGSARFMGGIVTLLGSAVIADFIANPERFGQYLTAFGNIWSQNIVPTMQFIFETLGGIGTMIIDWWNSTGESALVGLGTIINESLIFIIGTTLPSLFSGIGKLFKNAITSVWTFYNSIIGIFGYGEQAEDGIFANLQKAFTTMGMFFINSIDILTTAIIQSLGLSPLFGMEGDETLFAAFGRGFSELGAAIEAAWQNLVSSIWGLVDDLKLGVLQFIEANAPLKMIKDRLLALIEAVVGIFPSVEDIQRFMVSAVERMPMPDMVKDWLKSSVAPSSKERETYSKGLSDLTRDSLIGMNQLNMYVEPKPIIAPSLQVPAYGGGGSGRPHTTPTMSGHDRRLYAPLDRP